MDKHSANTAGNHKKDNGAFYKAIPRRDTPTRFTLTKPNFKKLEAVQETPFTGAHKPTLKDQETNTTKHKDNASCLSNTEYYFCEFSGNTSIHGFKFLGERGRFLIEKIFWLVIVCLAIYGSASLIQKAYVKWITSPVIVTFATTETPIWEIPFPAVTICPEVKVNRTFFNYTDVFLRYRDKINVTEDENEYFSLFQLVCDDLPVNAFETGTISMGNYVKEGENKTIISKEAAEKFLDALAILDAQNCRWLGKNYDCKDILSHTITSEGWCLTFNMLHYEEIYGDSEEDHENRSLRNTKSQKWSLENGYARTVELDTYPRRTMLSGVKAGFQIDLFVDDFDLDYLCGELQGFKVTLHHPAEEPDMSKHFRVPLNQAVIAGIKPRMITTAKEIKAYRPEERQCYLPNEKLLDIYEIYSQQSCMFECLANYTLQMCGCYPFYITSADEATCGPGSKPCIEEAKVRFLEHDVASTLNKTKGAITEICGCLPACTSLEFDAETSQSDWDWRKNTKILTPLPEWDGNWDELHVSRLMVYYKEIQFMSSERHELYGVVDFLANCGGLLGLFCGFSVTSLMEIVYFLTLRLCCNLKKFGRKVWSGSPELSENEDEPKG